MLDGEVARLKALGSTTIARLAGDHFLKHGLEAMGVLASAERHRPMVQFRNFIVHRYEDDMLHASAVPLRREL